MVPVSVAATGAFPVLPTQDGSQPAEPKKRAPRTKKQPTREEAIKLLTDASKDFKQIIQELQEDELRLSCMQLKKIPELIKETLSNPILPTQSVQQIQENYFSCQL